LPELQPEVRIKVQMQEVRLRLLHKVRRWLLSKLWKHTEVFKLVGWSDTMRHILGMAKRNIDLKGAKGPKLELDYLRLVYCVKELRRANSDAQGYLLVMTDPIARRVDVWQDKYSADQTVSVHVAQLSEQNMTDIRAEIQANIDGMVAGTIGEEVAGRSDASVGGQLGERQLQSVIESHEPNVVRCNDEAEFPFRIRWDYYGRAEGA
jgi:hypothetical protein